MAGSRRAAVAVAMVAGLGLGSGMAWAQEPRTYAPGVPTPVGGYRTVTPVPAPPDTAPPAPGPSGSVPVPPPPGWGRVVASSTGERHALVLDASGVVWAWGANDRGQLGDGTTIDRSRPARVWGLAPVVALAVGRDHNLVLDATGAVWAWGANERGQVGDGSRADRLSPVRVLGLGAVTSVAAGPAHSVAVTGEGRAWAWGANDAGQLGDGTRVDRLTPVRVGTTPSPGLGPYVRRDPAPSPPAPPGANVPAPSRAPVPDSPLLDPAPEEVEAVLDPLGPPSAPAAPAPSGSSSTEALLEALSPLEDAGLSAEEAIRVGMGRFPVGGSAWYTDDWGAPRCCPRPHRHQGTDVFAAYGTPARAPSDGILRYAEGGAGGKAAYVTEAGGTEYYLAHLADFAPELASGERVAQGQVIGTVGDSGNARGTSPHVHFEVHPGGGEATNPKPILDTWLAEALAAAPDVVAAHGGAIPLVDTAPEDGATAPSTVLGTVEPSSAAPLPAAGPERPQPPVLPLVVAAGLVLVGTTLARGAHRPVLAAVGASPLARLRRRVRTVLWGPPRRRRSGPQGRRPVPAPALIADAGPARPRVRPAPWLAAVPPVDATAPGRRSLRWRRS